MNIDPEFFTKIQDEWPHGHQLILKLFLKYANTAVRELTVLANTRHPIFDTPNRPFLSGMLRYGAVDYFLHRACIMNLLPGITPQWVPLTEAEGGVHALLLEGKHTSLIAHHLTFPDDAPRTSILRDCRRLLNERLRLNEQNPSLFDDRKAKPAPTGEPPKINLTLVHGGKPSEFAYLRIYHQRKHQKKYIPFSQNNIMLLEPITLVSDKTVHAEAEQIAEAEIQLKAHLKEITKKNAQE